MYIFIPWKCHGYAGIFPVFTQAFHFMPLKKTKVMKPLSSHFPRGFRGKNEVACLVATFFNRRVKKCQHFLEKKQVIYYVVKLTPPPRKRDKKATFVVFFFGGEGGYSLQSRTLIWLGNTSSIRVPFPASYEMELSHEKNPPTFHYTG